LDQPSNHNGAKQTSWCAAAVCPALQYLGAFASEEAAHEVLEEHRDREAAEFYLQYISRPQQ
jgi:hypothetical protein